MVASRTPFDGDLRLSSAMTETVSESSAWPKDGPAGESAAPKLPASKVAKGRHPLPGAVHQAT